jgi:uracil-DNA glycosylase
MRFDTWAEFLEHNQQLLAAAKGAVERDIADNRATVYPARADRLRFTETPLRDVRVVILGQDPYFKPGLADGLAFSVRKWVALPPSLRNILRELGDDLGQAPFLDLMRQAHEEGRETVHGDLTPWTRQGVLLLNTALTVRRGEAGSHCDIWQPFTDEVIRAVVYSAAARNFRPHFVLWGRKARAAVVRSLRHELCIADNGPEWLYYTSGISATYSAHPSPKSVNLGFFGSRPFSRALLGVMPRAGLSPTSS